jgi:hypothetical protein
MKPFWLGLAILAGAGELRAGAPADFSRYQIILDRSPFGPVTAVGAAEVAPSFSQKYQLVALVNSNAGLGVLQAVILDRESNRTFFRAAGETVEGAVKLVSIQHQPPKIVLQAGLETASLSFVDRPNAPISVAAAAPPPNPPGGPAAAPTGRPTSPVQRIPFRRSAQ